MPSGGGGGGGADGDEGEPEGMRVQMMQYNVDRKVALPEKVTLFSRSERGVVVVKFRTGYAAEGCIKLMDGRYFGGARMRCYYPVYLLHVLGETREWRD